jgi:6-phosphogluconolactonase
LSNKIDAFYLTNEEYFSVVADYIVKEAKYSINNFGLFKLLLSGGNTPIGIFKELVNKQDKMNWGKVELYWVDERCAPISSVDSNYGNCKRSLIDNLKVKPVSYPMYLDGKIQSAVDQYQKLLSDKFDNNPVFDLALLGIGEDGHVASIFPDSNAINEEELFVVSSHSPVPPGKRITLTLGVISSSKKCIFLSKGMKKKWVYESCIKDLNRKKNVPVFYAQSELGENIWFLNHDN